MANIINNSLMVFGAKPDLERLKEFFENVIADQSGTPNSSLIRYSFKLN